MRSAAIALLLLAAPAFAVERHAPVLPPVCKPETIVVHDPAPVLPRCGPTTPPMTACIWPGNVQTLQLADEATGVVVRTVALVESEPYVVLPPGATRFNFLFTVTESWIACPGSNVANWSGTVQLLADVFCAP